MKFIYWMCIGWWAMHVWCIGLIIWGRLCCRSLDRRGVLRVILGQLTTSNYVHWSFLLRKGDISFFPKELLSSQTPLGLDYASWWLASFKSYECNRWLTVGRGGLSYPESVIDDSQLVGGPELSRDHTKLE